MECFAKSNSLQNRESDAFLTCFNISGIKQNHRPKDYVEVEEEAKLTNLTRKF